MPGLSHSNQTNSVASDHRATELVVQTHGEEVDILLDVLGNAREDESRIAGAHEEMVVFEAERPARSEGIFDADTNCRAPAGFACAVEAGIHQKRTGRGVFVVG